MTSQAAMTSHSTVTSQAAMTSHSTVTSERRNPSDSSVFRHTGRRSALRWLHRGFPPAAVNASLFLARTPVEWHPNPPHCPPGLWGNQGCGRGTSPPPWARLVSRGPFARPQMNRWNARAPVLPARLPRPVRSPTDESTERPGPGPPRPTKRSGPGPPRPTERSGPGPPRSSLCIVTLSLPARRDRCQRARSRALSVPRRGRERWLRRC